MPVYEYRCSCGQRVETLAAPGAPAPACPVCGAGTRKVLSRFAVGGRADPGLSQAEMPQTWKGTYGGNQEYVTGLQRRWERRQRLEDRYPELAGDRRPVVAHEGQYSTAPLRAGDQPARTAPAANAGATKATGGSGDAGAGGHHSHPHSHPRPGPTERSAP